MLDPILRTIRQLFALIGRGLAAIGYWLLWPLRRAGQWYRTRGWTLRATVAGLLVLLVLFYGYFFYATQFWFGFDPDYPDAIVTDSSATLAGAPLQGGGASEESCKPSAIVAISAELIDNTVNRNAWVPSMLASKLGLFGMEWRHTPWFDNKAAFQLGINNVLRRTTTELVDTLGRVRGTSQIDQNLQDARTAMAWSETAWYIGWRGPTRPSPSVYREGREKLIAFNARLERCQATFDARADNLMQYLDRIASDIGSTSDILSGQIATSDAGWFDPRADDRFWFAYGQLYAYYGLLVAARSDFASVIAERNLTLLWNRTQQNLRASLNVQPWIISNGNESSAIFPSHLATMGFNLLQVRSNLVEIRSVLDR